MTAALVPLRRYVTSIKDGTHGTHERVDEGIPLLSAKNIQDGSIVIGPGDSRITPDEFREIHRSGYLAPGDVLLTIVGTIGRTAIYDGESQIAFQRSVASLRPAANCCGRYLFYCLSSTLVQEQLAASAHQAAQSGIYLGDIANIALPRLPLASQRAIATYLDRETARIDALIAAKRRMMKLLEERRRALRDYAFDCEPGWKLKHLLADSMAYGVLVPEFVESGMGVPMIRTYNLTARGRVDHQDIAEIRVELAQQYRRTSLRKGDLILSVVGSMGRSAVAGFDEEGYNLNRPLARLQLRSDIPSRLIWHWTQTMYFMDMAKLATGGGTAQPTLNLGDLANFTVGLPQDPDVWSGILATLESACERLDQTEDTLDRQIDLLRERRQALITAAVTGQLGIPEAA